MRNSTTTAIVYTDIYQGTTLQTKDAKHINIDLSKPFFITMRASSGGGQTVAVDEMDYQILTPN